MTDLPVLDMYSGLDHKLGMGDEASSSGLDAAPTWCNDSDRRRLNAYFRMTALRENKGRVLLREDETQPNKADQWREYGDVAVVVDQQAGAVLGQDPELEVDGADEQIPDEPDIPSPPENPGQATADDPMSSFRAETYQVRVDEWETTARAVFEEWRQRRADRPGLVARQTWLRDWAAEDRYVAKIRELEHDAVVHLGDGVIVHGYDFRADRPTTEIFHPETYFPALDDQSTNRFPRTVHIAWNFTDADDEMMLRVQTWELVDITENSEDDEPPDIGDQLRYLPDGQAEQADACVYSHRVYRDEDVDDIYQLDGVAPAYWEQHEVRPGEYLDADRVPWHTDFLPVIHIPNTLSTLHHFGRSPILRIAQAADEISQNDAWEGLAAHYAAYPVTGVDDGLARPTEIDLTPGRTLYGKVSVVDMAAHLAGLADRGDRLRSTMLTNSFTPEGMVGRIAPDEVPSGVALRLSFTAFEQNIERMRMARDHKYRLSAKMVQRLAIQHQCRSFAEAGGPEHALPAGLRFGTFMPQDLAGEAKVIELLANAKAASPETLVRLAQAAGAPIDDVDAEVAKIYALMADIADLYTSATEDPQHAIDFLGLDQLDEEDPDETGDPDGFDPESAPVPLPAGAVANGTG